MPKVAVLPEHIASQIAAGEVVERPASVIKELVENCLDAGATQIEIWVSSDLRDIRVADNGCGMEPDDAVLAFQRHATSKITSHDDLASLATLGFRGEALPSIASISKFSCTTRTADSPTGTKVEIKDGNVQVSETGCARGTIMEISDLFFNVPARLKFLKKPATEFGHIQEIVQSLAVAYPSVMIELKRSDNVAFKTTGTGDLGRTAEECKLFTGKELLLEVNGGDNRFNLKITGVVARPTHFRGDKKAILTMVNNRPVRCPLTYKALEYAYSDLIPRGRHPFAIINIQIDADQIDVNIHPTKKEIKYAESNAIYMALHKAIGEALRQPRKEMVSSLMPNGMNTLDQSRSFFPGGPFGEGSYNDSINTFTQPVEKVDSAPSSREDAPLEDGETFSAEPPSNRGMPARKPPSADQLSFTDRLDYIPASPEDRFVRENLERKFLSSSSLKDPTALGANRSENDSSEISLPFDTEISLPAGWRLAGYIHNTYFLFETPEGMEIIEQHIAHERLLYERILAGQETPGRLSEHVQRLCVSAPLNLTTEQINLLTEHQKGLQKLGFDFEFEGERVSCTQVPLELAHQNYATIIQKMIDDLATCEEANIELEASKSLACQSAIKNGMPLSERDILKLVSAWLKTPRNDTCPHGRPIRLKYTMDQIFQLFHPA